MVERGGGDGGGDNNVDGSDIDGSDVDGCGKHHITSYQLQNHNKPKPNQ